MDSKFDKVFIIEIKFAYRHDSFTRRLEIKNLKGELIRFKEKKYSD